MGLRSRRQGPSARASREEARPTGPRERWRAAAGTERGVPRAPAWKVSICVPGPLATQLGAWTGDGRSGLPTPGRGRADTSG